MLCLISICKFTFKFLKKYEIKYDERLSSEDVKKYYQSLKQHIIFG